MSKVKFVEKVSEDGFPYQYADMREQFTGYVKRDGSGAGFDAEVIANAEKELKKLSAGFEMWLADDIEALLNAHKSWLADPEDKELLSRFFRKAFDLRGQALTLGQPLIGDMTGSLALLLESVDGSRPVPMELVEAHMHAIKAVMATPEGKNEDLARELADSLYEASQRLLEKHQTSEDDGSEA